MQMNGPYGHLYYKNKHGYIEFYVELSGVPQYQYLIWFKDVNTWTSPEGVTITETEKVTIKSRIIDYLEANGKTSNIYSQ